jgi:hypothetical protein
LAWVPLAVTYGLHWPGQQAFTAALVFLPFLALVREDRQWAAAGWVGLAFAAHSVLAIGLAAADPEGVRELMPGAAAYWQKQEAWIRTGRDPEYELANWLPAHVQLFGAMALFSYTSLGFIPLLQGVHEVDLMNYYVGRLAAVSSSGTAAVLVGWHLWSVLRGVAFTFLVFEVASWSLARLCGRSVTTGRRRVGRWAVGLGFLVADGLVKYLALGAVRDQLFRNLQP